MSPVWIQAGRQPVYQSADRIKRRFRLAKAPQVAAASACCAAHGIEKLSGAGRVPHGVPHFFRDAPGTRWTALLTAGSGRGPGAEARQLAATGDQHLEEDQQDERDEAAVYLRGIRGRQSAEPIDLAAWPQTRKDGALTPQEQRLWTKPPIAGNPHDGLNVDCPPQTVYFTGRTR